MISSTISEIKAILSQARQKVALQVNQELISTYWKIGEIIVRYEQNDQIRAAYGERTLQILSKELTRELGKRFFSFQYLQYEIVLSLLSNFPDGVWKIIMVSLL